MAPMLRARGLVGLVEPLGFPVSSLRTKRQALDAIDAAGAADVYQLVHDTFHHHLAGETEFFPDRTGIVHISGVVDPAVEVDAMLDPHRVLVDPGDRLENLAPDPRLWSGGGTTARTASSRSRRKSTCSPIPESALRAREHGTTWTARI